MGVDGSPIGTSVDGYAVGSVHKPLGTQTAVYRCRNTGAGHRGDIDRLFSQSGGHDRLLGYLFFIWDKSLHAGCDTLANGYNLGHIPHLGSRAQAPGSVFGNI